MSEYKKIKIRISYEVECVLNPEIYWEGATDDEMINKEVKNINEYPEVYLDMGLDNETYKVEIL